MQAREPARFVERGDGAGRRGWHAVDGAEMAVAPRQQRGGAGRGEAFVGGAVGRMFRAHPGDEQGLPVVVFPHADIQCVTQLAAGAIRGHQQAGFQGLFAGLAGQAQATRIRAALFQRDEARGPVAGDMAQFAQTRFQRLAEIARHHHLAETLAPVVGRVQADPPEIALAADVDAPDRACGSMQFLHHAQRGQRVDRGRGEAEVALVEHRRHRRRRCRVHQPRVDAQPIQGDGQAGADQAAPHDYHVMPLRHAGHDTGSTVPGRSPMARGGPARAAVR